MATRYWYDTDNNLTTFTEAESRVSALNARIDGRAGGYHFSGDSLDAVITAARQDIKEIKRRRAEFDPEEMESLVGTLMDRIALCEAVKSRRIPGENYHF